MKRLLFLALLTLAGCTTAPAPSGLDPAVYRPTHRTTYPAPR